MPIIPEDEDKDNTRIPKWEEYNLLARCYLDFMQARIAIDTRARLLKEAVLIDMGLMEEIEVSKKESARGKIKRRFERRLIQNEDPEDIRMIAEQAKKVEDELPQQSRPYAIMLERSAELHRNQMAMLDEIKQMVKGTQLWMWAQRVRGIGDVAIMTLIGYINPDRVERVEQIWRLFGLTKDSKLVAGQKAHFNLELKGRMYLLGRNLIMQKDNYYEPIYRMKKDYYLALDEIQQEWMKKPGWKMHIDMSAKITMVKLVVSHAVEIILKSNGKPFSNEHVNHAPYLPPKPEDQDEVQRLLEEYKNAMPQKVQTRNRRYRESKQNG